ncbi:PDZ domain-containing protein, partial [Haematococcus lacustris]
LRPANPQVKSYKDLYGVLDDKKVGEKIKVELLRNERKVNVEVTLGERVLGQAE